MTVPENSNFGILDVRAFIGGRRILDVYDTKSNCIFEMTLREFEQYFHGKDRSRIYNAFSLEFSKSKMDCLIHRPSVIDSLDWNHLMWPPHLKQLQSNSTVTNYPKLQKFCLMSAAGSYTDFHVEIGGSSKWYHAFKGEQIFWIVPPTNGNLDLYERWLASGNSLKTFFGDLASKCQRFICEPGHTLIIPSGWIYAVYSLKDSIAFAGNFLTSFHIPMQLKIDRIERRLNAPDKFRFPFFQELHWYALERYIHCLTNKSHLSGEVQTKYSFHKFSKCAESKNPGTSGEAEACETRIHITPFEYKGLNVLIEILENLPKLDRICPIDIVNPDELLKAGKLLLLKHADDDYKLAITGKSKAFWPVSLRANSVINRPKPKNKILKKQVRETVPKPPSALRVRRVRCKQCEACVRDDCKECIFCRDMKKHGGPGTMKQTCIKRRCLQPILPSTCSVREEASIITNVVKPLEPQLKPIAARKEKRLSESTEVVIPAKMQKSISEDFEYEDDPDDVFEELPLYRPNLPVVTRISCADLLKYPIRPITYAPSNFDENLPVQAITKHKNIWNRVFEFLSSKDLCSCMLVCKDFLRISASPKFWKNIDLSEQRIRPSLLKCLVRRSPISLNLSQTNVSYKQLLWLLERSPSLRKLFLIGCSWSSVAALATASCPPLMVVDLSWTSGFTDPHLKHLLSVPKDARPGQELSYSRLRFCRHLSLAGTEISDKALKLLSQRLPMLCSVDLSFCNVTNEGISHITSTNSPKPKMLSTIIAQHCQQLTDNVFIHIEKLVKIVEIDLRHCFKISGDACIDFIIKRKNRLRLDESRYIVGSC